MCELNKSSLAPSRNSNDGTRLSSLSRQSPEKASIISREIDDLYEDANSDGH